MIGTVDGFRLYSQARGRSLSGDNTVVQAALVRGSDHVEMDYIPRFRAGYDASSDRVIEAVYEAAWLEYQSPGFFTLTFTPNQKTLVQMGDIRWQVAEGSKGRFSPYSTRVDSMLSGYIGNTSSTYFISRA